MNTKSVAKYYPALAAAERFSLMLDALVRGDKVEYARLFESAPKVEFQRIHTLNHVVAVEKLFFFHRIDQLDLAARYFKAQLSAERSLHRSLLDSKYKESATRDCDLARLFGYLTRVYAEGWKEFCDREQLNSAFYDATRVGAEVLEQAEVDTRTERSTAFTQAEAQEFSRRLMGQECQFETGKLVADSLQDLYKRLLAEGV